IVVGKQEPRDKNQDFFLENRIENREKRFLSSKHQILSTKSLIYRKTISSSLFFKGRWLSGPETRKTEGSLVEHQESRDKNQDFFLENRIERREYREERREKRFFALQIPSTRHQ